MAALASGFLVAVFRLLISLVPHGLDVQRDAPLRIYFPPFSFLYIIVYSLYTFSERRGTDETVGSLVARLRDLPSVFSSYS